jgi:hypothetical protein
MAAFFAFEGNSTKNDHYSWWGGSLDIAVIDRGFVLPPPRSSRRRLGRRRVHAGALSICHGFASCDPRGRVLAE